MNRKTAKKILPKLLLLLTVAALMAPIFCSCVQSDVTVLNVYNWGEYISDGSEDSYDTNAAFEEWYLAEYGKEVKVNYTTYSKYQKPKTTTTKKDKDKTTKKDDKKDKTEKNKTTTKKN